jgi:hypothetical protein
MFGFRMCSDEGESILFKYSEYAFIRSHAEMHRSLERVVTKKLMSSNLFYIFINANFYIESIKSQR